MKTNRSIQFLFFLLLITFFSCKKDAPLFDRSQDIILDQKDFNSEEINSSLKKLAQIIAPSLKEKPFRDLIKTKTELQFDSDYDVLWTDIQKESIDNELILEFIKRNSLTVVKNKKCQTTELENLIQQIPRLHISIPVNIEKWETSTYIPLITYNPYGIDESELDSVEAFDLNGNLVWLNANSVPEFPVIVIGVNERTDNNGAVVYRDVNIASNSSISNKTNSGYEYLYVKKTKVLDLKESWLAGKAELCLTVQGAALNTPSGVEYSYNYEDNIYNNGWEGTKIDRDEENTWREKNWEIFEYADAIDYYVFHWREYDGGWAGYYMDPVYVYEGSGSSEYYYYRSDYWDDNLGYNVIWYKDIEGASYDDTEIYTSSNNSIKYSLYLD